MKSRSERKDELTRAYGNLIVVMSEDDYDAVMSERQRLKELYLKFRDAHHEYHETLDDEAEIQLSDVYFLEVQNLYAAQQNAAKAALNDMQQREQMHQEVNSEQSFKALGHLINLPPLVLQTFSGEPDEYDNFIVTFNEVIGNVVTDPAARLLRLKSQLSGIALDSIKMCRTDGGEDGYARALEILSERFGCPYNVCNSIIEKLKHGPDVRTPIELRTFSDELANAEVTLKKNNMYNEIDTQNNIVEICLRLELSLRYKWRSRIMKNKQSTSVYLDFSDFVTFVHERAEIVNDPLYGKDALQDRSIRNSGKRSATSLHVSTQKTSSSLSNTDSNELLSTEPLSRITCPMCSKSHKLYTCYKFRGMPINERCDYVNTNKLCTLCLANDHSISQCRSTYICRVNNCGEKHSSALHVYNSQPSTMVNHCVQSCDKSNILMPTVPVVIDGTCHTFALLDSGSSTTFCSKRLMNQLKLQGSKTTYELQTLHGSKKQCTEVVSLHMSSTDGLKCLDMNNVVVVDNIPVERSHLPDVSNYPHLKDLTFSEATQVDILIGQDNSAALIPLDVRRGHVKAPFAILTMMGWSLNGCAPVSVPSHRVTSYVTSAIILDEGVHKQCEDGETGVAQGTLDVSNYQQAFILDDESLPHSPGKKPVSVMLNNTLIGINVIAITLCIMWHIFLGCVISLCILFLCGFTMRLVSFLEASYASMGGVLSQLYYISRILPYCVYTCIVSHPMTALINDT